MPGDILNADGSTSLVQTSTTNIGAYMWSAVAGERLGIIRKRELVARLSKTLSHAGTDGALRKTPASTTTGMTTHTGAKLTVWPPTGDPLSTPILSSVDNGWLAVGLKIVEQQRAAAAASAPAPSTTR